MRRLIAVVFAIGLLVGACSMPNFGPPKLGDAGRIVAVVRIR